MIMSLFFLMTAVPLSSILEEEGTMKVSASYYVKYFLVFVSTASIQLMVSRSSEDHVPKFPTFDSSIHLIGGIFLLEFETTTIYSDNTNAIALHHEIYSFAQKRGRLAWRVHDTKSLFLYYHDTEETFTIDKTSCIDIPIDNENVNPRWIVPDHLSKIIYDYRPKDITSLSGQRFFGVLALLLWASEQQDKLVYAGQQTALYMPSGHGAKLYSWLINFSGLTIQLQFHIRSSGVVAWSDLAGFVIHPADNKTFVIDGTSSRSVKLHSGFVIPSLGEDTTTSSLIRSEIDIPEGHACQRGIDINEKYKIVYDVSDSNYVMKIEANLMIFDNIAPATILAATIIQRPDSKIKSYTTTFEFINGFHRPLFTSMRQVQRIHALLTMGASKWNPIIQIEETDNRARYKIDLLANTCQMDSIDSSSSERLHIEFDDGSRLYFSTAMINEWFLASLNGFSLIKEHRLTNEGLLLTYEKELTSSKHNLEDLILNFGNHTQLTRKMILSRKYRHNIKQNKWDLLEISLIIYGADKLLSKLTLHMASYEKFEQNEMKIFDLIDLSPCYQHHLSSWLRIYYPVDSNDEISLLEANRQAIKKAIRQLIDERFQLPQLRLAKVELEFQQVNNQIIVSILLLDQANFKLSMNEVKTSISADDSKNIDDREISISDEAAKASLVRTFSNTDNCFRLCQKEDCKALIICHNLNMACIIYKELDLDNLDSIIKIISNQPKLKCRLYKTSSWTFDDQWPLKDMVARLIDSFQDDQANTRPTLLVEGEAIPKAMILRPSSIELLNDRFVSDWSDLEDNFNTELLMTRHVFVAIDRHKSSHNNDWSRQGLDMEIVATNYRDCASICLNRNHFNCKSFTYCSDNNKCILTRLDANNDAGRLYTIGDPDCSISGRNPMSYFVPMVVNLDSKQFIVDTKTNGFKNRDSTDYHVPSLLDCAVVCLNNHELCGSFSFCIISTNHNNNNSDTSELGYCQLRRSRTPDSAEFDGIPSASTKCQNYSRSILYEFEVIEQPHSSSHNSLQVGAGCIKPVNMLASMKGVNLEECAQRCQDEVSCLSFTHCFLYRYGKILSHNGSQTSTFKCELFGDDPVVANSSQAIISNCSPDEYYDLPYTGISNRLIDRSYNRFTSCTSYGLKLSSPMRSTRLVISSENSKQLKNQLSRHQPIYISMVASVGFVWGLIMSYGRNLWQRSPQQQLCI